MASTTERSRNFSMAEVSIAAAVIASINDLPVSNHQGSNLALPWNPEARSVDEELNIAASKLRDLHGKQRELSQAVSNGTPFERPKSGRMRPPKQAKEDLHLQPTRAAKMLDLTQDSRYKELLASLEATASDEEEEVAAVNFGFAQMREQNSQIWKQQFRQNVRNLMDAVMMTPSPEMAEKQLAEAHEWFMRCRHPSSSSRRGSSAGAHFNTYLEDEPRDRPLPGSAFFNPPTEAILAQSESTMQSTMTQVQEVGGRPVSAVRLASAKERLKEYTTKQIVRPLTARGLKAVSDYRNCDTPDCYERPVTPSTAYGGYSARSIASARSTPTPSLGSRPTSAASHFTAYSARGPGTGPPSNVVTPRLGYPSRLQRPMSAFSVASSDRQEAFSVIPDYSTSTDDTMPARLAPYPSTEAEIRMEERWLIRRNQDIANQVVVREQRSVVREWAERRARVEEEIARNTEAARYQSDLQRRCYVAPQDALEDIAPTVPENEAQSQQLSSPSTLKGFASRGQRQEDIPRFNVVRPKTFNQAARFEEEPSKPKKAAPLNARIAHLRRIHAGLIGNEHDAMRDNSSDEDEGKPMLQQAMLSAYVGDQKASVPKMEDDADVLIGVCDWWQAMHGMERPTLADSGINMEEVRFNQMKEVEKIKRVFAQRNCPINVAVLERALVMPQHQLQPGALSGNVLFNTKAHLLSNPFAAKGKAKKKKPTSKKGKKKDSKGSENKTAQSKTRNPSPKKGK